MLHKLLNPNISMTKIFCENVNFRLLHPLNFTIGGRLSKEIGDFSCTLEKAASRNQVKVDTTYNFRSL
jgi:hypothetical protein